MSFPAWYLLVPLGLGLARVAWKATRAYSYARHPEPQLRALNENGRYPLRRNSELAKSLRVEVAQGRGALKTIYAL